MSYNKIIILGYGVEGKSVFNYLRGKYPLARLAIADRKKIIAPSKGVAIYFGKNYLKKINDYDLIVKSPGIPPETKEIKEALKNGAAITSTTKIFFNDCRGKIIGVTGTKGKSTTSTLIYKILKKAKKKVHLVGNIGNPPLAFLDKNLGKGKIFVYELSSYQLNDLNKSPWISIFLNVFPDHMPYHGTFINYQKAKANIAKFQSKNNYFVYNSGYSFLNRLARASKGKAVDYIKACSVKDGVVYYRKEKIIPLKGIRLLGKHNLDNIFACVTATKILKTSNAVIVRTIKNFKGLEHRLELVGRYRGIKFYDDAISTTPESTIAAIDAFKGGIGTIILGGENRGYDFSQLAKKIIDCRIKNVVLFPDSGIKIWKEIIKVCKKKRLGLPKKINTRSMAEAIKFSYKHTPKGDICLLSTASPSYSLFKNFIEKGDLFKEEVKKQK